MAIMPYASVASITNCCDGIVSTHFFRNKSGRKRPKRRMQTARRSLLAMRLTLTWLPPCNGSRRQLHKRAAKSRSWKGPCKWRDSNLRAPC